VNDRLTKALSLLPHGPEFRFIDRLLSLEPGHSGVAELLVRGDEPFLRGHFPSQPLFPGVLLIEAAAQLSGIVAQSDPTIPPLMGLKLTAVKAVKITGSARPGDLIRLEAHIAGRLSNLVQVEASALIAGQVMMRGALTLSGDPSAAPHRIDSGKS